MIVGLTLNPKPLSQPLGRLCKVREQGQGFHGGFQEPSQLGASASYLFFLLLKGLGFRVLGVRFRV